MQARWVLGGGGLGGDQDWVALKELNLSYHDGYI